MFTAHQRERSGVSRGRRKKQKGEIVSERAPEREKIRREEIEGGTGEVAVELLLT